MSLASPADALGETLLILARNAIDAYLGRSVGGSKHDPEALPELRAPAATFVTLTQAGALRGCIGSLEARRPLLEDVRENAIGAAFRDPRFQPLTREEIERTRVEVSLLSPPEALVFTSEDDARQQLVPGEDGLIFQIGSRRATFLPQVWESLPSRGLFLAKLKEKAGFPADWWSPEVRLYRYRVRKWKESER